MKTDKKVFFNIRRFRFNAAFFLAAVLLFCAAAQIQAQYWKYTWKGDSVGSSRNWGTASNWTATDESGISQTPAAGGPKSNGDTVTIPATTTVPADPKDPVLSASDINLLQGIVAYFGPGSILIESGATLTVNAGRTLTCGQITINSGAKLINNGTIIITTDPKSTGATGALINNGELETTGPITAVSLSGSGTSSLGGNITTTASQTYGGAVTFTGTPVLQANATLTFNAPVSGSSFTANAPGGIVVNTASVNTTGNQTWQSPVSITAAVTFTTAAAIRFQNTVTAAAAITLEGGSITFNNEFRQNPAATFTVNGGAVTVGANAFIAGNITLENGTTFTQTGKNADGTDQSAESIDVRGTAVMIWDSTSLGGYLLLGTTPTPSLAAITTNLKNVYIGNALQMPTTTPPEFLDLYIPPGKSFTPTADFNVRRNVIIAGGGTYTAGSYTMILGGANTLAGSVADHNAVLQNLGSVTITHGATSKTFSTPIKAGAVSSSPGTGLIAITNGFTADSLVIDNSPVTLGGPLTINTTGMTFPAALTLTANTVVNTSAANGPIIFNGSVSGSFALEANAGTGSVYINTTTINTGTGGQTYKSPLILDRTATLTAASFSFEKTVDAATAGTQTLTIVSAGVTTFSGQVGATKLASLAKNGTGATNINGAAVSTTGTQTYGGAVTFSNAAQTSLTASAITFSSTLAPGAATANKNLSLTTTGAIQITGAVASDTSPIGNLILDAGSANAIIFGDAFYQDAASSFTLTSGKVAVSEKTFKAGNLSMDAANSTFTQTGVNTTEQSVTTITGSTAATMIWDAPTPGVGGYLFITGEDAPASPTVPSFTYNKKMLFYRDGWYDGGNADFLDLLVPAGMTVQLRQNISVKRNVTIENGGIFNPSTYTLTLTDYGTETGTIKDDNTVTKQNLGTVIINQAQSPKNFTTAIVADSIIREDGIASLIFSGLVTTDTTYLVKGDGRIAFNGGLTAENLTNAGGTFSLSFNEGTGVQTTTVTNSVTLNTTGIITINNTAGDVANFNGGLFFDSGAGNISLGGTLAIRGATGITFLKPVTLNAAAVINTATGNGPVTFNGNVNGSYNFTVNAGTGEIHINTATINTDTGTQAYQSPVVLDMNTALTTTSGSISFAQTVTNTTARQLTLTTGTGSLTFSGAVGSGASALASLAKTGNGTTNINGGAITTSGIQSYAGPVTLGVNTTLTTTDSAVSFAQTVTNTTARQLTLTTGIGSVTFSGAVGSGTTALASLTKNGTGATNINGGAITTSGIQSYAGPVTLGVNTTLTTTDSAVSFAGTVTNTTARQLTLSTGTGSVTFSDAVGTSAARLSRLTKNGTGATNINGGNVWTTGNQIYGGPVTADKALTLTNGGYLDFKSGCALSAGAFVQNGTGDVQLAGTVQTTAGASISFASNVFMYGTSALDAGTGTIYFTKDLYIAAVSAAVNSPLALSGSFVLMKGAVSLGVNCPAIPAAKDIALFGGAYDATGTSGVTGLFAYAPLAPLTRTGSTAEASLTLPASLPDGTDLPKETETAPDFSGTFTANTLTGKTLSAGQNFYANGINLNTVGAWTLNLKDNKDALNAFAEAYNLSAANCTVTTAGTWTWVAAGQNCTDGGGNTGWAFSLPQILANDSAKAVGSPLSGTYTIYDDIIRVEFRYASGGAAKIENLNNEIGKAANKINFNGTTTGISFTGTYKDPECTIPTNNTTVPNEKGELVNLSVFYLKTNGASGQRWNTDATGNSFGNTNSTDRGRTGVPPAHRTVVPNVYVPTALSNLYQTLRDEYKNRVSTINFIYTADRCRPVLIEVRTGQESHNPVFGNQKPHDAHNFIEFRYSEAVNITAVTDTDQNIQVTDAFGAIDGASGSAGLKIAGMADIASGRLQTGSRQKDTWTVTADDKKTHSLYRSFNFDGGTTDTPQTHRIRLSLAGLKDGTTTLPDGKTVPYYPGFIDTIIMPAAAAGVTVPATNDITDKSGNNCKIEPTTNNDTAYGTATYAKISITVNVTTTAIYGMWDIKAPAPARSIWDDPTKGDEILGSSIGVGNITQFEFHLFDNQPDYSPTAAYKWIWDVGWFNAGTSVRPDTVGGARPDYTPTPAPAPNTAGGLRAGSLAMVWNAFSIYDETDTDSRGGFTTLTARSVSETFFFGTGTDVIANNGDSLYFSLTPVRNNLASRDTYNIRYDSATGFITDLAGNRLKSGTWESTDRIPPKIVLTISPYDEQQMLVFFNKALELTKSVPSGGNAQIGDIHNEFIFHDKTGTVISDLTATRASFTLDKNTITAITLSLSRKLTLDEVTSAYISLKDHLMTDWSTGRTITVSNITDSKTNWMKYDIKIPVTYLGINMMRPLYATNSIADSGSGQIGTVTVREPFNGTGFLFYDREIRLSTTLTFTPPDPNIPLTLFIDTNPIPGSLSTVFNQTTGKDIRFWLPTHTPPNSVFAQQANTKAAKIDQLADSSATVRNFDIPVDRPDRKPGDLMEFLFQYGTFKTPDISGDLTVTSPFYLVPLTTKTDLLSLRLYSFKALDVTQQRGGTTILNNVINVNTREETVLEIDMPASGSLNISVMTIDGNIVKILHRGRAESGKSYYRWDGTNGNGRPVARGMYFVRISGTGIDETRKVMVVRD